MLRNLSFVCGSMLLAACQSSLMLMPTPEVLKDERFNVFQMNPEPLTGNELRVLYATTRVPDESGGAHFTGKPDTRLHLGYAELRIGDEGMNAFELIDQATTEARTDQFAWHLTDTRTLSSVDQPSANDGRKPVLSEELTDYFAALNGYIDANPVKELTIYAHGANNTFYWSVSQAAQFQFFSGDNAIVLAFAWPSPGRAMRYGSDKRRANAAATDLAYLIELLAEHSIASRINLLGYSAGGRVIGGALAELGARHAKPEELRIGQVYLTQSDEPLVDFIESLPLVYPLAEGLTVTIAAGDPVLSMARITDGKLRLGAAREGSGEALEVSAETLAQAIEIMNSDRMFFVDIRNVPQRDYEFSHGAWYESPWVSTDVMVTLLAEGMSGSARGLVPTKVNDVRVWRFPDDYVERVTAALLERSTDGTGPASSP